MSVFLKSLCNRLNEISINEELSGTKEPVDALNLKAPCHTDILVHYDCKTGDNCSEYKGKN